MTKDHNVVIIDIAVDFFIQVCLHNGKIFAWADVKEHLKRVARDKGKGAKWHKEIPGLAQEESGAVGNALRADSFPQKVTKELKKLKESEAFYRARRNRNMSDDDMSIPSMGMSQLSINSTKTRRDKKKSSARQGGSSRVGGSSRGGSSRGESSRGESSRKSKSSAKKKGSSSAGGKRGENDSVRSNRNRDSTPSVVFSARKPSMSPNRSRSRSIPKDSTRRSAKKAPPPPSYSPSTSEDSFLGTVESEEVASDAESEEVATDPFSTNVGAASSETQTPQDMAKGLMSFQDLFTQLKEFLPEKSIEWLNSPDDFKEICSQLAKGGEVAAFLRTQLLKDRGAIEAAAGIFSKLFDTESRKHADSIALSEEGLRNASFGIGQLERKVRNLEPSTIEEKNKVVDRLQDDLEALEKEREVELARKALEINNRFDGQKLRLEDECTKEKNRIDQPLLEATTELNQKTLLRDAMKKEVATKNGLKISSVDSARECLHLVDQTSNLVLALSEIGQKVTAGGGKEEQEEGNRLWTWVEKYYKDMKERGDF